MWKLRSNRNEARDPLSPSAATEANKMKWFGILVVSPLWGVISTQLFLQSWPALINFLIALLGFFRGAVKRKDTAMFMGVAIFQIVLFSALLSGGFWLLTHMLLFGYSRPENVVYWILAGLSAWYMLPQIPSKIRKSWRNAMIPGSLEADIWRRKMGLSSNS